MLFRSAVVFIISLCKAKKSLFYKISLYGQSIFYVVAIVNHFAQRTNKFLNMMTYYSMTILAQWKGVINSLTGRSKPVWEKAKSTR